MTIVDPKEVEAIVVAEVAPTDEAMSEIKKQAEQNVSSLMAVDIENRDEVYKIKEMIDSYGKESMQSSTSKNSLTTVMVGKLAKKGEEGGEVAKSLLDLQRTVKDLDPSMVDFSKKGFLGKIFNPVRGYFEKYQQSESVIDSIVKSLDSGKEKLRQDNVTLRIEESNLRELTKQIAKEIEMGTAMDELIEAKLAEAKAEGYDADKVRFVEEEILFPLRQRVMDLHQMTAVNQQGIIAMNIVQRNNKELMTGVDRAKAVTISALRTAVMVASALYDQEIVLEKISALNETTNKMIAATAHRLKTQGAEVAKQAMSTSVSVDTLKQSFSDVMEALEQINTYKRDALPMMRNTITQFKELADKGEVAISKLEKGNVAAEALPAATSK